MFFYEVLYLLFVISLAGAVRTFEEFSFQRRNAMKRFENLPQRCGRCQQSFTTAIDRLNFPKAVSLFLSGIY